MELGPYHFYNRIATVSSGSSTRELLVTSTLDSEPAFVEYGTHSTSVATAIGYLGSLKTSVGFISNNVSIGRVGTGEGDTMLSYGRDNSAVEFLLPITTSLNAGARFANNNELPRHPLSPLHRRVRTRNIIFSPVGMFPIGVGNRVASNRFAVGKGVDSRFVAKLLFTLPLLGNGDVVGIVPPIRSEPCVSVALGALGGFNVAIARGNGSFFVPKKRGCTSPNAIRSRNS